MPESGRRIVQLWPNIILLGIKQGIQRFPKFKLYWGPFIYEYRGSSLVAKGPFFEASLNVGLFAPLCHLKSLWSRGMQGLNRVLKHESKNAMKKNVET